MVHMLQYQCPQVSAGIVRYHHHLYRWAYVPLQVRERGLDDTKVFLRCLYWCINIGAVIAQVGLAYLQLHVARDHPHMWMISDVAYLTEYLSGGFLLLSFLVFSSGECQRIQV